MLTLCHTFNSGGSSANNWPEMLMQAGSRNSWAATSAWHTPIFASNFEELQVLEEAGERREASRV